MNLKRGGGGRKPLLPQFAHFRDTVMKSQDIIRWREELGVSQVEASKLLGVSKNGYQKWEYGDSPIDIRTELATKYIKSCLIDRSIRDSIIESQYTALIGRNSKYNKGKMRAVNIKSENKLGGRTFSPKTKIWKRRVNLIGKGLLFSAKRLEAGGSNVIKMHMHNNSGDGARSIGHFIDK